MSDASLITPGLSDDPCDESAPNEREARRSAAVRPPMLGVALSVLWWLEGDVEKSAAGND